MTSLACWYWRASKPRRRSRQAWYTVLILNLTVTL